MATDTTATLEPLWLAIETEILGLDNSNFNPGTKEKTVHLMAKALDNKAYNVSRHGGHLLELRSAVEARISVGRPLLEDFNEATTALKLEDLCNTLKATVALANDIGETWPMLKAADRRNDIRAILDQTRLDLLVAEALGMDGDKGTRLLIAEGISSEIILSSLSISQETLDTVHTAIAEELAAIARVNQLLEEVTGQSDEERARHLITNDIPDEQIIELAKLSTAAIQAAKSAMEAEIKEKQRLAEEEAARKKAEADGPGLDDIAADDLLDFLESIEEIMEFTEEEKELRQMCEQSSIPKCLVDIAVATPDKIEEMREAAEG